MIDKIIRYKIIVDSGKPYEEIFNNAEDVKKELIELKKESEEEDSAFIDVNVLCITELCEDVTNDFIDLDSGEIK
jgi:short-subunit dehydrogenase